MALRERYRYGTVELLMRDGVIMRLVSAERFENVGVDAETLLELIRETCPSGEVTIITKNGRPYRLKETVSFDYL